MTKKTINIEEATFSIQIPADYNFRKTGIMPGAFYIWHKDTKGRPSQNASQLSLRGIQLVPQGQTTLPKGKWNERLRMKAYADQYGKNYRKLKMEDKFRKDNSGKLGRVWYKTFEERKGPDGSGNYYNEFRFHAEWRIFTKKYCYVIQYDATKLDEKKLKELRRIFYSIRLEKVKGEDLAKDDCEEGKTKLLEDLAIKTTFYLPHPTKEPFFIQKPFLPKDAKAPASWAFFTDFCISAIEGAGILKNGVESITDVANKDFLSAAVKQAGWSKNDAVVGAMFNPDAHRKAKMEDMTSVVSFYLVALRAAADGTTAIGQKMNKSASDYYYEVPYMGVSAKCIPQMICENGKWEPDYSAPVYVEIEDSVMGSWSKKDIAQTPRQIARIYKKEFQKYINTTAEDGRLYKRANKCYKSMDAFMNIKWPGQGYDACAHFKAQRAIDSSFLKEEDTKLKQVEAEYKAWITKGGRKAEIKRLQDRVIALNKKQDVANDAIKSKNKEIDRINDYLDKNFTTPELRASSTYKRKVAEIEKLKKDKIGLGKELISIAHEKDLIAYQQEIIDKNTKKIRLEKELAKLRKSVKEQKAKIKKTNEEIRRKKCK